MFVIYIYNINQITVKNHTCTNLILTYLKLLTMLWETNFLYSFQLERQEKKNPQHLLEL